MMIRCQWMEHSLLGAEGVAGACRDPEMDYWGSWSGRKTGILDLELCFTIIMQVMPFKENFQMD